MSRKKTLKPLLTQQATVIKQNTKLRRPKAYSFVGLLILSCAALFYFIQPSKQVASNPLPKFKGSWSLNTVPPTQTHAHIYNAIGLSYPKYFNKPEVLSSYLKTQVPLKKLTITKTFPYHLKIQGTLHKPLFTVTSQAPHEFLSYDGIRFQSYSKQLQAPLVQFSEKIGRLNSQQDPLPPSLLKDFKELVTLHESLLEKSITAAAYHVDKHKGFSLELRKPYPFSVELGHPPFPKKILNLYSLLKNNTNGRFLKINLSFPGKAFVQTEPQKERSS